MGEFAGDLKSNVRLLLTLKVPVAVVFWDLEVIDH